MNLFFTQAISNGHALLTEPESKHAIQVLRMKKDDPIFFIDGKGGFYEAKIQDPHPKKCVLSILSVKPEFGKLPYQLHLAVAPTKNIDRFEWILEKCTEMGIDRITPLLCDRSERKVVKPDRLERVILSAVKQSLKAYLPELCQAISFKEFIHSDFRGDKMIAHCEETPRRELFGLLKPHGEHTILIGPEGDFTSGEIAMAEALNFTSISLGRSRLRTETAAIVACSSVYNINSQE